MAVSVTTTTLFMAIALAMVSSFFANAESSVEVTRESWPDLVGDKNVLVMFSFPWCQHCHKFKSDWKKIKKKFADDSEKVFLEVDCSTEAGNYLCQDFEISGVPEMYYGDVAVQAEYEGRMDDSSIISFIQGNMTVSPLCSIIHKEYCPEEDRAEMIAIEKLTDEFLAKITATGISNPGLISGQAVLKNGITNPFWYDVAGIDRHPDEGANGDGMSAAYDMTEEIMAETLGEL